MKLSRIPALPLLAGMVIGIILALECGAGVSWAIVALPVAFLFWWKNRLPAASVALFISVGIILTVARMPELPAQQIMNTEVSISAKVEKVWGDPMNGSYIVDVTEVNGQKTDFKTLMHVMRTGDEFIPGDVIQTKGVIRPNDPRTDLPDEINLYKPLYREGVVSYIYTEGDSIQYGEWHPSVIQRYTRAAQDVMQQSIVDMGCDGPTTAFLLATVAGDDEALESWREDNFRTVGVAHVLALSGMHVAVIVWLAMILVNMVMCLPRGRVIGYVLLGIIILLYAFATGMSASVGRATVMVLVFILSALLNRKPSPYNSLFFSVLIWLCINPFWLFSPGLQLSATAVFAILWLNPMLCRRTWPIQVQRIMGYVTVPIVAIIGTTMFTAFYFHSLPVWFLPVNIIAGITVPALVAIGVIGALICACGLNAGLLSRIADAIYGVLDGTVNYFAALPGGVIDNIYPQWWQLALYLLGIAVMGWGTWRHAGSIVLGGILLIVACCITFVNPVPADDIDALYIPRRHGYTDIIIREGNSAAIISDGHNAKEYAEYIYADYLKSRCIDSLTRIQPDTPVLQYGKSTILLLNRDDVRYSCDSVTYLLVGRGFSGDIADAASRANPDTVLLAASLNPRRGARYIRELEDRNIPVRSLHDTPFALFKK